jgi:hypothetical protein
MEIQYDYVQPGNNSWGPGYKEIELWGSQRKGYRITESEGSQKKRF